MYGYIYVYVVYIFLMYIDYIVCSLTWGWFSFCFFSVHRNLFVKKLTNKFGKLTHDFVAQIWFTIYCIGPKPNASSSVAKYMYISYVYSSYVCKVCVCICVCWVQQLLLALYFVQTSSEYAVFKYIFFFLIVSYRSLG